MLSYLSRTYDVLPGWLLLAVAGIAVVSYALGCCNGAIMVSRGILRDDIRQYGSGNGGLTNFCRTHGGFLSVVVILIDVLKAVVSLMLARYIFGVISPGMVPLAEYWAGFWCILGHMFPCTFQFRGGKGVLSSGAMAIVIDWRLALLIWGCFLILAVATRFVSLGACVGALAFPIGSYFLFRDVIITVLAVVMAALVIFKHRGNIVRLIKGKEPKFVFKWGEKKTAAEPAPEAVAETPADIEGSPAGEPQSEPETTEDAAPAEEVSSEEVSTEECE